MIMESYYPDRWQVGGKGNVQLVSNEDVGTEFGGD
jgi:hypothetical protein